MVKLSSVLKGACEHCLKTFVVAANRNPLLSRLSTIYRLQTVVAAPVNQLLFQIVIITCNPIAWLSYRK